MKVTSLNIPLPEDLMKLKWSGQFALMKEMIDIRLQKDIPQALKERLMLEKEIIDLYPREFIYSKEEALKICKERISDFKDEEFDVLFKAGDIEFFFIEGELKIKNDFFDNITKTKMAYAKRCKDYKKSDAAIALDDAIHAMIEKKQLAYKIHIRTRLQVNAEKEDETVRVWLPIPLHEENVHDFKIIDMTPGGIVNPEDTAHRNVYYEEKYEKGKEYFVEYEFVNAMKYNDPDPALVSEEQPDFCLEEQEPHFISTPYLQSVLDEILEGETNPLLKAKKIYYYVTGHLMYSFVRQYITLPCIPMYAATGWKGDCGIMASLFITLCRMAHIPAQWQSGLYANPYMIDNHDWAKFYVAPFGWLYADCSFGNAGVRTDDPVKRAFYFGNLEPFRIPSAVGFQQDYVPDTLYTRRDPYDNQTGEVEFMSGPIKQEDYVMKQDIIEIVEVKDVF
ncbi:MAG: transglutaminase domain-containing protein [Holdemanella sp.]|nr:transglutaminase domain-containing protein [Holdemanella sp.]